MYMVNKPNQSAAIVDAIINFQYMVMVIITASAAILSIMQQEYNYYR